MAWVNRESDGSGAWVWQDDTTGTQYDDPTQDPSYAAKTPSEAIGTYSPGGTAVATRDPGTVTQTATPLITANPAPLGGAPESQTMSAETGQDYMNWVGSGGSGQWDDYRKFTQTQGKADPGAYDPSKTPGVTLDPNQLDKVANKIAGDLQGTNKPVDVYDGQPNTQLLPPSSPKAPVAAPPQIPQKPAPLTGTTAVAPTPPQPRPSTALNLDENKPARFWIEPDGSLVYVLPGQKVPGANPIDLTPAQARKMGWGGVKTGTQTTPNAPVNTPTNQTTAPTTRTMYENPDGSVTPTPKDDKSTPVQVSRNSPTAATAANAPSNTGPTPDQLKVDATPMTATTQGIGQYVNDPPMIAAAKAIIGPQIGDLTTPGAKQMIMQYAQQLTQQMQGYGPMADRALNLIAQLAWYRQTGGQQGAPENAPKDYVESWKGSWRTGKLVPLGPSVDQALVDAKIAPPSVHETINAAMQPHAGVDPVSIDKAGRSFANVQRLNQNDQSQYANNDQWAAWYASACGAASFAAMVNAANPTRNMTVGEAVNFLQSKNLISQSQGLLRGSDFTDISSALNEAIGKPGSTIAVNYRQPEEVQKHFASGGGAIMFTGPSTDVWGQAHIYVVTGADANGVTVVDSSRANKTSLTWDQWRQQTALPGMGAGAALVTNPAQQRINEGIYAAAKRAQGGAVITNPGTVTGSNTGKEGRGYSPLGGKGIGDTRTEADVRTYQQHIINDLPLPANPAPASQIGQEGFIRQWKPTLDAIQQETGLDAGTLMGLIISESGWGDETSRVNSNNYFGMRPNANDTFATGENRSNFATYPNAAASLARFVGVLSHPENTNYAQAWQNRSDPNGFISGLISGGYAPAGENDQANWRRIITDNAARYRTLQ